MAQAARKDEMLLEKSIHQFNRGPKAKEVELTAQQKALWTQTRTSFLWCAPGFAHILYKLMNPGVPGHIVWTKDIDTAATDGEFILANPDFYFGLGLHERVFVLGHEVLHAVFNHAIIFHGWRLRGKVVTPNGTVLPYDEQTMQVAADHILNALLTDSKIGKCPVRDGKPINCNPTFISHKDQLTLAYQKIYQQCPPQGGKGQCQGKGQGGQGQGQPGQGKGNPGGNDGFDTVMKPGEATGNTPGQAKAARNEQVWKTTVAAAMAAAKARGLLSGSMMDCFGELLDPKVAWDEYIQGWFKRKLGSGAWNFRRPDRRYISRDPMIYAPSRQGYGADAVALGIDTSGSIDKKILDRFFGEMVGIVQDVRPRAIYVLWCDAYVHRVDEVETYEDLLTLYEKGAPGRGGTAFEPVFDRIKEMGVKLDAMVYLTDGDGSFPKHAPDYPVLWGDISNNAKKYPWGEIVNIPV